MTATTLARSSRVARAGTVALALAATALTVSGPASAPAVPVDVAVATAGPDVVAACLSAPSVQRVRADSGRDGVDPNDLAPAQVTQAEARLAARTRQRGTGSARASVTTITIDVYVHVITTDAGKGGVSRSRIKKQVAVLNKAYAGRTSSSSTKTPFSFRLKAIDKTKSSDWYHWSSPDVDDSDDVEAKTALHRGGPDDLNLYVASLGSDLLGYSSFPFDTALARDGVVVLNASLPGGSAKGYDRGDTATHEVGHWLGLFHTFENGCASPGDEVDDTPAQADGQNIFSCDSKLDTCTSAGRDPVHNFMSYGDDKCLNRFTSGQVARMTAVWQAYRATGAAS
ncbi:MAG: zinc metalloprotease [Janthinobacterium lividum]